MQLTVKQKHWLDFVRAMTSKEIKARYKKASFGFLWILINPLSQMLVMGVVFQHFVPVAVDNYFLFLFSGLLPWNFFSQSLAKATPAFFYERNLIKKAQFPREAIVLSIVLSNFVHFLISFLLLLLILLIHSLLSGLGSWTFFANYLLNLASLIPVILLLLAFTSGLSLLTASLNVRFRDVNFMVQLALMLWFYATPIIYTLDLLPQPLRSILYLNPMTGVIELFHHAVLGSALTEPSLLYLALLIVVVICYLGWQVFRQASRNFDDWL